MFSLIHKEKRKKEYFIPNILKIGMVIAQLKR